MSGSPDDLIKQIDLEISKPLPGSTKVSEAVVEDEMAMFMQAQSQIQ